MSEVFHPDDRATEAATIAQPAPESVPAWELIAEGRYMPRRIRGSFLGRELG